MKVADRQQIGLPGGEPVPRRPALAFGTMAVATGVVRNPAVAAVLTTLDMAAERSRAAVLDGRHHLELVEAEMPGIGPAPVDPMAMKNVCDLQPRAVHDRPATPRVAASRRSRVRAGRADW